MLCCAVLASSKALGCACCGAVGAATPQAFDLSSLTYVAVKIHQLNSMWSEAKKQARAGPLS